MHPIRIVAFIRPVALATAVLWAAMLPAATLDSQICDEAARQAAITVGVPEDVLLAIGRTDRAGQWTVLSCPGPGP